jgi:cytochrome c553
MMKSVFAALVAAAAFSASAANAPASAPVAAPAASAPAATAAAPAAAPVAASTPAAPDAGKGAALFATGDNSRGITACGSCHGPDGNAPIAGAPKLASQHAAYIVKQLNNFKSGERKNALMAPVVKSLTDDEIRNLAAYLSTQPLKPSSAKSKDTVDLGKKIFRAGIRDKNVPACNGCHGPTGAGIPAQFARIGGQNEDYVEAQLTGFASGARTNNPIMATIAARMSPNEIKAVSDYVAGLR